MAPLRFEVPPRPTIVRTEEGERYGSRLDAESAPGPGRRGDGPGTGPAA